MVKIKKRLLQLLEKKDAFEVMKAFEGLFNWQCLTSATLNATGAIATVSLGANIVVVMNGDLVTKASGSTITLNGPTILTATSQVWLFTLDLAGNLSAIPGLPSAALAAVGNPFVAEISPSGYPQVVIGGMSMVNTSGSSFIPNSTLLNVANLGITAFNTIGPFYPIQPI